MLDLSDVFGPQGSLAHAIPGFSVRREQAAMAACVASAIAGRQSAIIEAGTGVGKTFAYLVPALLAGRRCLISTGTRSLQDQLFSRDLPMIAQALGRPVKIAMLKGRTNYLCRYRTDAAETQAAARGFKRELAIALNKVRKWSLHTRHGDVAELSSLAEDDAIWPWVTSTRDNCLGTQCGELQRCHVMAARREAQAADIVVVNHHLLLADLLLKEGGFGELLPGAEAVIVDEAHQLPDVAAQAFGFTLSARQLRELARDLSVEFLKGAEFGGAQSLPQTLERLAHDASEVLGAASEHVEYAAWTHDFIDTLHGIEGALQTLVAATEAIAREHTGIGSIRQRAVDMLERCMRLLALPETQTEASVRWAQSMRSGFALHHAPIDASKQLAELIQAQGGAWIFTSATLAVGEDFEHFKRRIGLSAAVARRFGSPFDYTQQALLYLPRGLEFPSSPKHTRQVIDAALPILEASGGRAFLLFTSYRALREAAQILRARWSEPAPFPLLVQGEAPRDVLLRRFRDYGNAVLLGTGSFWEGVDVKGTALSVVIIDKLPFAAPNDPLLKARLAAIEAQGGNPFFQEQIPQAVMVLKQGVGRLIRDMTDFGVVMLCDRRLLMRSYGRIFLQSLPPMPRTEEQSEACEFLSARLAHHQTESQRDVAV